MQPTHDFTKSLGRQRAMGALICTLLATLALGGCESGASAAQTPLASTTPSADACGVTSSVTTINGVTVSPQAALGELSYPTAKLPTGVAPRPLVVAVGAGQPSLNPDLAQPTNPLIMSDVGGGYVITLQNTTSTAHSLARVEVCLDKLTPVAGELNEWQPCDTAYTRSLPLGPGGCGGNTMQNEYLHAPFTANPAVGTVVTATRVTASSDAYSKDDGPLPVRLQPGETMTIEIGLGPTNTCPTADDTGLPTTGCVFHMPGTYVFAFGLAIDNAALVFAVLSPPTLLAPAREWTGSACTRPAMQALIPPASNPPTYYICPV